MFPQPAKNSFDYVFGLLTTTDRIVPEVHDEPVRLDNGETFAIVDVRPHCPWIARDHEVHVPATARRFGSDHKIGRLLQVCERWIYSAVLCFAVESVDQERTGAVGRTWPCPEGRSHDDFECSCPEGAPCAERSEAKA